MCFIFGFLVVWIFRYHCAIFKIEYLTVLLKCKVPISVNESVYMMQEPNVYAEASRNVKEITFFVCAVRAIAGNTTHIYFLIICVQFVLYKCMYVSNNVKVLNFCLCLNQHPSVVYVPASR